MAAIIIQINKNANLIFQKNVIRITNVITSDILEIHLNDTFLFSKINMSSNLKVYIISVNQDYPNFSLHGYHQYYLDQCGLYCARKKKDSAYFISTKDFTENDFTDIADTIKENITSNIPKNGFWININSVLNRKYLKGADIINICNNSDIINDSRLMTIYEYIFMLLREKKDFEQLEKVVPSSLQRISLLNNSTLIYLSKLEQDNWPFIVQDPSSPTRYSLVRYPDDSFSDITKISYEFCNNDILFGKPQPQLYAIGYGN